MLFKQKKRKKKMSLANERERSNCQVVLATGGYKGIEDKASNRRIVSTDRSIKELLYWLQPLGQYTSRQLVILRPDVEPE